MECHPALSQLIIVPLQSRSPQQETLLCGGKSMTQKPTCQRTLVRLDQTGNTRTDVLALPIPLVTATR